MCVYAQLKYTQQEDPILEDKRDYMGNLVSLTIINRASGKEEVITDEGELSQLDVIEEEVRV